MGEKERADKGLDVPALAVAPGEVETRIREPAAADRARNIGRGDARLRPIVDSEKAGREVTGRVAVSDDHVTSFATTERLPFSSTVAAMRTVTPSRPVNSTVSVPPPDDLPAMTAARRRIISAAV